MNQTTEYLEDLKEIKNMMSKSSKFVSLSGLSGIFAGTFALLGAAYFKWSIFERIEISSSSRSGLITETLIVALVVMIMSIAFGYYFSKRKAETNKLSFWDKTTIEMLKHGSIPFLSGGLFCLGLLYHGYIGLIAPATLIVYGISLISASKFTHKELYYLGLTEILLSLFSIIFLGHGLLFWVIGFGILHIIYGITTYLKYERYERSNQ